MYSRPNNGGQPDARRLLTNSRCWTGSVFHNLLDAAEGALVCGAASTQPLSAYRWASDSMMRIGIFLSTVFLIASCFIFARVQANEYGYIFHESTGQNQSILIGRREVPV